MSSHELASQFGLEFLYTRKTSKTIANTASHTRLFISMKQRPAIHGQRNRQKEGVSSSWLGAHRPCNSDNLDGDGRGSGGPVRTHECVCVCMRACVCARVMCFQYTIIIFDPG